MQKFEYLAIFRFVDMRSEVVRGTLIPTKQKKKDTQDFGMKLFKNRLIHFLIIHVKGETAPFLNEDNPNKLAYTIPVRSRQGCAHGIHPSAALQSLLQTPLPCLAAQMHTK